MLSLDGDIGCFSHQVALMTLHELLSVFIQRYPANPDPSRPFINLLWPSIAERTPCIDGAAVRRRTGDRKVAGSTRGRGAIKSTRSTQPSRVPGCMAGVRWGAFTCVGWQVILCDPIIMTSDVPYAALRWGSHEELYRPAFTSYLLSAF